ncbi:GNAT family N-acetyltransferase [Microbacterium abyssi]|uniref:GNAT family N-acetyltransferase n=1 Tax=Microbacterium abyssi TaxID=2782166 RepID=UPI001E5C75D6|nr:GNAT family N-acetyltransferase [Microbacterium sp. A18JL241]
MQTLTESDWRAWRSLRLRALQDAPFAFGSRYEDWKNAPEERWRQRLRNSGMLNVIALRDGIPAGMVGGMQGERIELISMWVAPEARGHGVGDALISAVEAWAIPQATELWLAVVPTNSAAVTAYVRNGFEHVDEPGDPLPEDRGRELLMRKRLG